MRACRRAGALHFLGLGPCSIKFASPRRPETSLKCRGFMAKQKRVVKMPALAIEDSSFAPLIRRVIEQLVDNPDREGLTRTPERVEKALRFLTSGYHTDVRK